MLVLKPYFESHEEHIDAMIDQSVSKVRDTFAESVKKILYQLVIQSNQSFLSSIMSGSKDSAGVQDMIAGQLQHAASSVLSQWSQGGDKAGGPGDDSAAPASAGGHKPVVVNILSEFCHLLHEGVMVQLMSPQQQSQGAYSVMLTLNHHRNQLCFRRMGVGQVGGKDPLRVPLWEIAQVSMDMTDGENNELDDGPGLDGGGDGGGISRCVSIDLKRPIERLFDTACYQTCLQFYTSHASEDDDLKSAPVEDTELIESVSYGLSLLIQQFKSKLVSKWGLVFKLFQLSVNRSTLPNELKHAWRKWKSCISH